MTLRFRYLGVDAHGAAGRILLARLENPDDHAADFAQLRWLVARVRQQGYGADDALRAFVESTTAPYYRGGRCSERQRAGDVAKLCGMLQEAIQSGALLRPDFLPAFTETLAWQLIKNRLRGAR